MQETGKFKGFCELYTMEYRLKLLQTLIKRYSYRFCMNSKVHLIIIVNSGYKQNDSETRIRNS